ncbi:putative DEAD/DEAH box helicase-like protein [Trypanosoma conorhini]|uniref:DNA 3'-5' helicase n=1 Tax=Trypanosoma conorhini TaxID=83891 RepID=A0A422Q1F2_9TRYP|nr:putative DEAD/DEAH box helicase-like protein [Trypanosoma conorhini]RNF23803.1 putative DEAD/DEAH box helicase-like protein [Trypanosoma conorhini]
MSTARECLGPLISYLPYPAFTRVQETVIPALLQGDGNVVVAAPTGSGKTALLEVAMLRLFQDRLLPRTGNAGGAPGRGTASERKAVYVCPIKALASEKYGLWRDKFPTLSVALETGDQELSRGDEGGLLEVPNADIIITTPERWDSITRRWKEGVVWGLVASVALLLLDEVHTVSEERGAALEAVVSRMKAIKASLRSRGPHFCSTRFVAISGTLPNIADFAEWLQVEPGGVFSFTSADRPVPLTLRILSYPSTSNNPFAFDRFLSFKLFGLIRQFSAGRPSIVFCASRNEAINSSLRVVAEVRETAAREGAEDRLRPAEEVERLASSANDKQLRGLLLLGIAYHHAAMSMPDRVLVERMFREHYISVICTTTTLALGVNLPAHLVIIKGTTFFKSGRREDLPLSEVAQMGGRAGRPGLDTHGIALVLTTEAKAALYEPLRHGDSCSTVESQLHQKMIEHVNAEVALRTIHSFSLGVEWIKTTFLWIRLRHCPRHYGILFSTKEEESSFDREEFAAKLMHRMLTELERQGCISIRYENAPGGERCGLGNCDARCGGDGAPVENMKGVVESTRVGRAMARRYVLLKTVELLNGETARARSQLDASAGGAAGERALKLAHEGSTLEELTGAPVAFVLPQLIGVLSRCAEFEELHLRQGDRRHLNEMNKSIRYPLKSGVRGGREVREDWHKVYVLLQAHLAHMPISDFSLRNDSVRLWTTAPRLARFLVDYAGAMKSYSFLKESFLLLRCMEQKMWWDGPVLRQLEGVSEGAAKALLQGGVRGVADVVASDPRKLEALCGKNIPFGNELQDRCRAIPRCGLSLEPCAGAETLKAVVTLTPQPHRTRGNQVKYRMVVIVGNAATDAILLFRQFSPADAKEGQVVFTFHAPHGGRGRVVGQIFTEQQMLGIDVQATLNLGEDTEAEGHEDSAHKAAAQTKQRKRGKPTLHAFDGLLRDLRWVEGSSPRTSAHAAQPCPQKQEANAVDTAEPSTDAAFVDQPPAGNSALEKSSSCDAAAVIEGGGSEAAEQSHPRSGGSAAVTDVDEDYRELVRRTSCIASQLRFNRDYSPVYPCKRSREETSTNSSVSFQPLRSPFADAQEGSSSAARPGASVSLPKAVSPDPVAVSRGDAAYLRPSARFRVGVQYAAPQEGLPEPPFRVVESQRRFAGREAGAFAVPYGPFGGTSHTTAQQPSSFVREFRLPPRGCQNDPGLAQGPAPPCFRNSVGGLVAHHSAGADAHLPWHRGFFPSAAAPPSRGWPQGWAAPSVANPRASWEPPRATRGYSMFSDSRTLSNLEPLHGSFPAASMPGFFYQLPGGHHACVAPRTTAVQRGWW